MLCYVVWHQVEYGIICFIDSEIVDLRGNLSKYKNELQTTQTKITEIFEPAQETLPYSTVFTFPCVVDIL